MSLGAGRLQTPSRARDRLVQDAIPFHGIGQHLFASTGNLVIPAQWALFRLPGGWLLPGGRQQTLPVEPAKDGVDGPA
jgi:hypothetical protein